MASSVSIGCIEDGLIYRYNRSDQTSGGYRTRDSRQRTTAHEVRREHRRQSPPCIPHRCDAEKRLVHDGQAWSCPDGEVGTDARCTASWRMTLPAVS
ncbi:MAG: hypothetical protein OEW36_00955, partial [Hylemonella sp.]|nr:hypothetical protein [Hylemonella sp.]